MLRRAKSFIHRKKSDEAPPPDLNLPESSHLRRTVHIDNATIRQQKELNKKKPVSKGAKSISQQGFGSQDSIWSPFKHLKKKERTVKTTEKAQQVTVSVATEFVRYTPVYSSAKVVKRNTQTKINSEFDFNRSWPHQSRNEEPTFMRTNPIYRSEGSALRKNSSNVPDLKHYLEKKKIPEKEKTSKGSDNWIPPDTVGELVKSIDKLYKEEERGNSKNVTGASKKGLNILQTKI